LKAHCSNGRTVLDWSTASEENTSYFEVRRSLDGVSFSTIGKVQAAGKSETLKNYSFDAASVAGTAVYYQVRLIEVDNKSSLSNTVTVNSKENGNGFRVVPNRISNQFNVIAESSVNNMSAKLQLLDMSGRVIWTRNQMLQTGSNYLTVTRTTETKGIYVLVCTTATNRQQQRIMID
jgi:hypothetical protein